MSLVQIRRVGWLLGLLLAVAASCSSSDDETSDEATTINEPATLTVRNQIVNVDGDEVAAGKTEQVKPGSLIETLDDGRGGLEVPSLVQIDVLRGTMVEVPDRAVPRPVVRLTGGQIIVEAEPDSGPFDIVAGNRTFNVAAGDTSLAICYDPTSGAACLYAFAGEVFWTDPHVTNLRFGAGEGTFAANGDVGPEEARCGAGGDMDKWKADAKAGLATPLDQAVGSLSVEACGFAPEADDTEVAEAAEAGAEDDSADPGEPAPGEVLPSSEGMVEVIVTNRQIGTSDWEDEPESYRQPTTLDGTLAFHVDASPVANHDYRNWVSSEAKDDGDRWEELAPAAWIEDYEDRRTQATYPDGEADQPVVGVTFAAASAYCRAQHKTLVSELQWELAAVDDKLRLLGPRAREWVRDWEQYGDTTVETEGRQVLRGNDLFDRLDLHARTFAPTDQEETAIRKNARIRCSAEEVASGGQLFDATLIDDDFSDVEWYLRPEDPLFQLEYHTALEVYHLELNETHAHGAVLKSLEQPLTIGRIDLEVLVEREFTPRQLESYRFGLVIGGVDGFHTFTVLPDETQRDSFLACLMPLEPTLDAELRLRLRTPIPDDGYPTELILPTHSHYGEQCTQDGVAAAEVSVADIDDPITMSLAIEDGSVEARVDTVVVGRVETGQEVAGYGLYTQTYNQTQAHIHFDQLTITAG